MRAVLVVMTALALGLSGSLGGADSVGSRGAPARRAAAPQVQPGAPAKGPGRPLRVQSSSLSQDGQNLVWRLVMGAPFSPGGLEKDGRTLCLLFERAGTGTGAGEACLTGPAPRGHAPRLVYRPITAKGPGSPTVLDAPVDRSSTSNLTATFLPSAVGHSYDPLRWQVISSLRPPACVPVKPDRVGCYTLYPARPTLLTVHVPLPVGCVPNGSSLVFNGSRNLHDVALTFDDGPWPSPPTSQFLDVLERYHVPATFFEIAEQIGPYDPGGTLERRMLADGDMIGNHTWSHPDMTKLSYATQRQQLVQAEAAIKGASGFEPCLWRPPYGAFNSSLVSLARSLGLITIVWDVDTQDWTTPGTATIYQRAVGGARNGSIILQHFGGGPRYQTLAALPQDLDVAGPWLQVRHRGRHAGAPAPL